MKQIIIKLIKCDDGVLCNCEALNLCTSGENIETALEEFITDLRYIKYHYQHIPNSICTERVIELKELYNKWEIIN